MTDQNVAVTVGAKQGIFNALMAVLDPGDNVLVLSPYWVSYPPMVMLAGGNPVVHETKPENGFKVTAGEIHKLAAGSKIRAVILNTPSNPTGAVYTPGELSSVYEACRKHDIFILSDEIYSNLTFDGIEHFSAFHLEKRISDGYCVVDGMSKSFAMTGWRVGWVVGPPELVKAVSKVTAQTTSCAVTFIQKGCVDALGHRLSEWDEWKRQLAGRRERIVSLLGAVPGVSCRKPDGAFYVWVDARELMSRTLPNGEILGSSDRFSRFLVEDAALIVVPGGAFGCEGFMRFSFAMSMQEIEEGIDLFRKSIEKLS
jgi:aspartate aminotransferase